MVLPAFIATGAFFLLVFALVGATILDPAQYMWSWVIFFFCVRYAWTKSGVSTRKQIELAKTMPHLQRMRYDGGALDGNTYYGPDPGYHEQRQRISALDDFEDEELY